MKDGIPFETMLMSLLYLAVIISALWLITEPISNSNFDSRKLFYKINYYISIIYGFFLTIMIIVCLSSNNAGFGYYILILSGTFFAEFMRNTLDIEDRVNRSINENRVFVMSGIVTTFSVIFPIIMIYLELLERINEK